MNEPLRDVSKTPSPPPYPADTKVGSYGLQLDMQRIEQSTTWIVAAPDLRPWLLMLWAKAWAQIPAGSLPDDDEVIAALIGTPDTFYAAHKRVLMRGWERCSDGRMYHRYLTGCVQTMLRHREQHGDRQRRYRAQAVDSTTMTQQSRSSDTLSRLDVDVDLDFNSKALPSEPVDKSVDKSKGSFREHWTAKGKAAGIEAYPGESPHDYADRVRLRFKRDT